VKAFQGIENTQRSIFSKMAPDFSSSLITSKSRSSFILAFYNNFSFDREKQPFKWPEQSIAGRVGEFNAFLSA